MERQIEFEVPVLGFAAYSGTGKTTLLVKLLPLMKLQGLRIAMIKQTHHDFEIDKPGKDSFLLRKAGADQMMLASDRRCAVITEYEEPKANDLVDLISKLDLEKHGYRYGRGLQAPVFFEDRVAPACAWSKIVVSRRWLNYRSCV